MGTKQGEEKEKKGTNNGIKRNKKGSLGRAWGFPQSSYFMIHIYPQWTRGPLNDIETSILCQEPGPDPV